MESSERHQNADENSSENEKAKPEADQALDKKMYNEKKCKTNRDTTTRVVVVALTPDRNRETWNKKVEFLLAVIGFAVDLGNVWRFPYICYQNGGGAFLIPYTIMLVFGGLPLFYMELALGQFHRSGCLTIWKRICPALKGIGYAICLIDIYMGMYYNTIIGWAVYYLVASFQSELPWTRCNNIWNTIDCRPVRSITVQVNFTSPAREFFEREVLEQHKSDGLNRMGPIKPALAMCVFAVFVLVYFSLWKGVRSAGKAVWITALAPYVVLIILLVRGVTLPGAANGIRYYLTPEWYKLYNMRVWIDAASQIFFSLGPGFGTLLALSSYNKFNNNCYRDAIITSIINCLTSFLAGFVIFSVLGYMAFVQHKSIEMVGLEGPGLVFIVYPEAIATMKGSVFWSIIFFLMLITLGLDSTFGGLEAMITALCDEYPRFLGRHREIFVAVLLLGIYICALPTTTYGGVYLVNMLNVYGPGLAILFVVFVEAAGVCWLYGTENFARDIEKMLGHRPGLFWTTCWKYISPVFLLVIFIFSLMGHAEMLGNEYQYPDWSFKVGYCLTASSIICIPIYIVYKFLITPGSVEQELSFQWSYFYIIRMWFFLLRAVRWSLNTFGYVNDKEESCSQSWLKLKFPNIFVVSLLTSLSLLPLAAIILHALLQEDVPNFLMWIGEDPWARSEIGTAGHFLERPPNFVLPKRKDYSYKFRRSVSINSLDEDDQNDKARPVKSVEHVKCLQRLEDLLKKTN